MKFSERLAQLRKEHNMTQQELAEKLGVSRGTIGMYEIGQRDPDTETLAKIAEIFGVSTDYLLGRTDLPNVHIPEEYTRKHKVTKRDLKQYENFILKQTGAFFMDDQIAEEDKEEFYKKVSELFWKAKELNKQKYGRRKKKA